jgi:hypothetical protein
MQPQRVLHEGALSSEVLLELRRRVGPALELASAGTGCVSSCS